MNAFAELHNNSIQFGYSLPGSENDLQTELRMTIAGSL